MAGCCKWGAWNFGPTLGLTGTWWPLGGQNFQPWTTSPRGCTTHSVLGPLPSINQENAATGLFAGQSDGRISSIESLSSQMTLTCIKLTKPNPHPSLCVDHQAPISGRLLSAHQGLGLVLLHWV